MLSIYRGVFLTLFISFMAYSISVTDAFRSFGVSAIIVGILLGFILGNIIPEKTKAQFHAGVGFSSKRILRLGVILYGFQITFTQIIDFGISGILSSGLVVLTTAVIGTIVGIKLLKIDKEIAVLISSGSAICGAAAVLATESTIKASAYKSSVAVGTVVIFGTIAMFAYPFFYNHGFIDLSAKDMGVYIGATIHEVAHVVTAGTEVSQEAAESAIVVKMIRVIMLVPFLLVLPLFFKSSDKTSKKLTIPWFAFVFLLVVAFNTFVDLGDKALEAIRTIDVLFLTMAMSALGFETTIKKVKDVGFKPFLLAIILFAWLIFGGFYIVKFSLMF